MKEVDCTKMDKVFWLLGLVLKLTPYIGIGFAVAIWGNKCLGLSFANGESFTQIIELIPTPESIFTTLAMVGGWTCWYIGCKILKYILSS